MVKLETPRGPIMLYNPFPLQLQHWYSRIMNALYWVFSDYGYRVIVTDRKESLPTAKLLVVFTVHIWNLVNDHIPLPDNICALSTEGLDTTIGKNILGILPRFQYVLEFEARNMPIWESHGVTPLYMPIGYSPYFTTLYQKGPSQSLQDIDILMFGSLIPQREALLESCRDQGWRCEHVCMFDNLIHMNITLKRSKIILVTHQHATRRTLDLYRLHYLASNGCFILHEDTFPGELPDGIHECLVTVAHEKWIETCRAWLDVASSKRLAQAESLRVWFRENLAIQKHFPMQYIQQFTGITPSVEHVPYVEMKRGFVQYSFTIESIHQAVMKRPAHNILLLRKRNTLDILPIEPTPVWITAVPSDPLIKADLNVLLQQIRDGDVLYTIYREKHIKRCAYGMVFPLEERLRESYPTADVFGIDGVTEGKACTTEIGLQLAAVDREKPILITACDNGVSYDVKEYQSLVDDETNDVIVWSFRNEPTSRNNPDMYAWMETDEQGYIQRVSCKKFIEGTHDLTHSHVIIGTMFFRKAKYFMEGLQKNYDRNIRSNGEFYVDDVLNQNIAAGLRVKVFQVEHYICWGTPNDYETYLYYQRAIPPY